MGELLYLAHHKHGAPGVADVLEARMPERNVQQLLESLEPRLCRAFAQATALAGNLEELKNCLHCYGPPADSALRPLSQATTGGEASSARQALLNASSELARLRNSLLLDKAALDRALSKLLT